ncbi:MAG: hypothetical protein K8R21_14975, partial [Leptospira sp.]|nr:hypothetical protein [Leptospira sp.]
YSMNSLVPDLPVKLLVLGFAEEAAHFQNMLINSEKLSGTLDPVSYERLSFYQTISGDLASGEETLNSLLRHLSQKELFKRNEIYLRLGAIAFLRRDYKGALKYSLNLNFKNWGPMIRNPFTGEPVSVNTAKDLAAVYVWKSKSSIKAVKALGVIKKGEAVTEPELFVRLRMAHILFPDKPDVAEKITEEIIYTAQSRGWKQAEYSATLLQGYIHIINKNYRKAVIQFTKAYGILGENFPDYSSEWVRNAGLVAAHRASGEPAPLDKQIHYLATRFRDRAQYDDLFCLKNYLDLRFDTESFMKNATEYYIENRNYSSLVELLFSYHKSYFIASRANKKGILQIADADKRLKLFGSMKPEADGKYFSGELNKNREEESERNRKVNDEFDSSVFENLKDPVLICLPWKKQFFLFFYNPAGDAKWKFAKLESSDFKSSSFQKLINEYAGTVRKENTIQIFLNPPGMEIYQYLRSKSGPQNFVFFYNFSRKKNIPVSGNLVPVAVPRKGEPVKSSVAYYDASYFEGSKLFHEKARLHIWNFYGNKKDSESGNLEGYIWEAGKDGEIHFNRLRRRMDYRTSPEAILFT